MWSLTLCSRGLWVFSIANIKSKRSEETVYARPANLTSDPQNYPRQKRNLRLVAKTNKKMFTVANLLLVVSYSLSVVVASLQTSFPRVN